MNDVLLQNENVRFVRIRNVRSNGLYKPGLDHL
jgi:hypothetical protein